MIYDTSFSKIASILCNVSKYSENGKTAEVTITNANENGEIFAFGKISRTDDEFGLYLINISGVKRFEIDSNNLIHDHATLKNLERIKEENGYYFVDIRGISGIQSYYGIFDKQCNVIFEPSEMISYYVYNVKILSENEFYVHFIGKDKKIYWVKTDGNGKFLEEPHENE